MYKHEAGKEWQWFESYLSYANAILPESLLCAYLTTGNVIYKEIAKSSFDFLLAKTFEGNKINVISNAGRLHSNFSSRSIEMGGEQPIDVAYTILALSKFQEVFIYEGYSEKSEIAFNWFLGNNHLHRIIYNPCTGGCFDGLETEDVNLNQGAESTVSYLMAALSMKKAMRDKEIQSITDKIKSNNSNLEAKISYAEKELLQNRMYSLNFISDSMNHE